MIETLLKIGAKLVVVAVIFAALIGLFSLIPIPNLDLSPAVSMMNTVYSVLVHWFPWMTFVWPFAITMFSLQISIWLIKPIMVGYHYLSSLWD